VNEQNFPLPLEVLLASTAEVLRGRGAVQELTLLSKAEVSVELVDYDNWNGGTFGWGLQCSVDLKMYGSLKANRAELCNVILDAASQFFEAYENHSLSRVTMVAHPITNPAWREESANLLEPTFAAEARQKDAESNRVSGNNASFAALLERRGFRLLEPIGSGLSGTVYRAQQVRLDRMVAVKCCDGPEAKRNPKIRQRFIREARMLAMVQHPSVPYVLTSGNEADTPYIVMQLVDGESLRQRIKSKGRLEVREATEIISATLSALALAHDKGIVHRDVKPENILISSDGAVYLIDFSIGGTTHAIPGLTGVTGVDNTPGTIAYMAPEALRGEERDHRVDIFATGVVLFEAVVGRPCALDTLQSELLLLDPEFANVVATACAAKSSRYPDARAFAAALGKFTQEQRNRGAPATAICRNARCPEASWDRGYSPSVQKDSTDRHCRACGQQLAYPCERCGRTFDGGRYCPGCGSELFAIPSCTTCGSPLRQADVLRSTDSDKCTDCNIRF
jgi:predicted Ser/Thr protein kinase